MWGCQKCWSKPLADGRVRPSMQLGLCGPPLACAQPCLGQLLSMWADGLLANREWAVVERKLMTNTEDTVRWKTHVTMNLFHHVVSSAAFCFSSKLFCWYLIFGWHSTRTCISLLCVVLCSPYAHSHWYSFVLFTAHILFTVLVDASTQGSRWKIGSKESCSFTFKVQCILTIT